MSSPIAIVNFMDANTALNVVLAVASVAAAGVAIGQAVAAKHARDDADEYAKAALAHSQRQVAAQESIAARLRPDPWGDLTLVSGQLYMTKNTSGETLRVTSVGVTPGKAQGLFRPRTPVPSDVRPGEAFRAMLLGRYGLSIDTVVIHWTDESGTEGVTRLSKA